ncbi:amino acid adenylation domain-containing protein [Streptomyces noursei]|uniref:non-ribosomal peptide synthetase family protein n=1 Tax=Streptomyces noursei TaxID=1971 RepID=UPI0016796BBE|nr:amino acid adenylation domain-containing protein [Streptomyces noursei]MCZ1013284.1 amino acid adenylation domain-containing protein [Streptomyces noursei]
MPALLLAAHARVLATVVAERDLLIGFTTHGGHHVQPLSLTVTDSAWAELADRAVEALTAVHHAESTPETVLDLSGLRAPAGASGSADTGLGEGAVLRVAVFGNGDGLGLRLQYDRAALDDTSARRLAGYHLTALELLGGDPGRPHHTQSLLSASEVETQLYDLAGPRAELSERTFVDLFEEKAAELPDAVAATHHGTWWTYRELNERADRIAQALLTAGARREDAVAVVMNRTLDWIAAAIGVFKAGCVYLPVRPDFPADRVATQLQLAACVAALTEPDSDQLVRDASVGLTAPPAVLSVPSIHASSAPTASPGVPLAPADKAYVYFTSGSTGTPKGAVCEHAGLLNHLQMKIEDMGMTGGTAEVVAQTASQCFDISLWQFAAPLLVGGSVRIVDTDVQLDVAAFVDELVEGRVTVAQVVPSYLEVLLAYLEQHPRTLGTLRALSVTGEALKHELIQRWFSAHPGIGLVNAYGATEVSDDTMHEILNRAPDRDLITVGTSRRNVITYVLDEQQRLAPLGSPGEIAFSGVCVGRGYINDEERTRQAFLPDPYRTGTRMYRTGDFGRWLPDGRIEFLGRRDEQVKIRGFRIEIGEIENKMQSMSGLRESAIVVDRSAGGEPNLVAFFSGDDGITAERIRDQLADLLPEYMVPAYLHRLDRLPLTENGKVDKKMLGQLAGALGHGGAVYAAPGTPTEQRLARLWAEALGVPVERISRGDNFFERGGTSLAAVRLLVNLDRALSLKDLATHPVLSDLARVLDARRHGATSTPARRTDLLQSLSAIRDPHHILVCFPYAGGNAVNFRSLAAELERHRVKVLAVELPGHDIVGDADEVLLDIPEVARRVRQELLSMGDTPVLLWGHCAGAAAALETARLLEEAGRPARRLFIGALLFDDPEVLRAEMNDVTAADDRTLLARLREDHTYVELDSMKNERAGIVSRAYRHDVLTTNTHLLRIHQGDPEACRTDVPIEVVVAGDDPTTAHLADDHGAWKAVSSQVALHELSDGGHYFISTRPAETARLVLAVCAALVDRDQEEPGR